jgi:osmotically inducible protein OsmC
VRWIPGRDSRHQQNNGATIFLEGSAPKTPPKQQEFNPQGGNMASKASAVWTGSLKEGKGTISTATGVLKDANYSFATRFEGATSGTTPEELIAAAHASCFSMALGAQLGGAGLTPTKIETQAAVTLAKVDAGFAVTKIALITTATVPGANKEAFDKAAADAKAGCPISKLFANNTEITLDAKLV